MDKIEELYQYFVGSTGVNTDTRKIEQGNIFFALRVIILMAISMLTKPLRLELYLR